MEVVTLASLAALVWKIMSVVKDATGGESRSAVTQVVTWVVGIGVAMFAAHTDITAGIEVWDGMQFGDLDLGGQVLAGLTLASTASVGYDVKTAVDNTDSAAEPPLGG